MQRVQAGDRDAFGDLYDAIAAQVFGVVTRVLRDPAMSEEVTQAVFVEIWRHAARFDPERASVSTWAITMARRRAVDRVRREQSQRNGLDDVAPATGRRRGAPTMSEQRVDELLALAALGELDPAEETELDSLLAAESGVVEELAADLDTAADLQRTTATPPPAHLKARVMEAIDGVEQVPSSTVAPSPGHDASPSAVTSIHSARSTRRARRWQTFAAAAVVVLVLSGGLFIVSNRADAPGPVDAVIEADDAVVRTFSGDFDGELRTVFSAQEDAMVLDGSGVGGVGDDETYQLWLVDGAVVRSVGLFDPDDEGNVEVRFDGIDPGDQVVAITVEPAGGSETPTLPIVATA